MAGGSDYPAFCNGYCNLGTSELQRVERSTMGVNIGREPALFSTGVR
jgi:hypothetical protein